MNAGQGVSDEISLFRVGAALVRARRRILWWTAIGGLLAGLTVIAKPKVYTSSAAFLPQGNDPARSGLASLAGQFGVNLPAGNQGLTPDFYVRLLRSRRLLGQVARDTFAIPEEGRPRAFVDLFGISGATAAERESRAVLLLLRMVSVSAAKATGLVELSVSTKWPSVSRSMIQSLIDGVNAFNQQARQEQARLEREFVEGRLRVVGGDLRAAEDQLQQFLLTNRQAGFTPVLMFERERLQRVVTMKQGLYMALAQSREESRLREVRDTPVITIVEPPLVPAIAEPRGRVTRVLLGSILGLVVGSFAVMVGAVVGERRRSRDPEVTDLFHAVDELRSEIAALVRRPRMRS